VELMVLQCGCIVDYLGFYHSEECRSLYGRLRFPERCPSKWSWSPNFADHFMLLSKCGRPWPCPGALYWYALNGTGPVGPTCVEKAGIACRKGYQALKAACGAGRRAVSFWGHRAVDGSREMLAQATRDRGRRTLWDGKDAADEALVPMLQDAFKGEGCEENEECRECEISLDHVDSEDVDDGRVVAQGVD